MTTDLPSLTVPFATPWQANREGGVSTPTHQLLGYSRYDHLGGLADAQLTARWFAVGPDFAAAAIALHSACRKLAVLVHMRERLVGSPIGEPEQAAISAALEAEHDLLAAAERLLDPMVQRNAAINAGISDFLTRLPRIPAEARR